MSDKIRIAFIKFGGLAAGGTEKYLQQIAANLPKDRFVVDYFYCDAAPYLGSDYKHADTDPNRLQYMQEHNVNLIKFNLKYKNVTVPTHDWIDTDFWEKFNEKKYDLIQTGRAGHPEYPFTKITKTPIIDSIHLPGMVDNQKNIAKVIHVSEWNKNLWIKNGGDASKAEVVYLPIKIPSVLPDKSFRQELNIENKFVVGLHQRNDENIFSSWPLQAFSELSGDDNVFILLGGSEKHTQQTKDLNLKNFIHIPFSGDMNIVYKFLKTLDVYLHGRKDGEINSQSIAEALYFGLPIISHYGINANGHVETIGKAGVVHKTYENYVAEIKNYKNNLELRNLLSGNAKKRFEEKYSFDKIMNQIIEIYEKVVNENLIIESNEEWLQEWLDV